MRFDSVQTIWYVLGVKAWTGWTKKNGSDLSIYHGNSNNVATFQTYNCCSKIDLVVRSKVYHHVLEQSAEELLSQLLPIVKALHKTQNDICTIAEAINIYLERIMGECSQSSWSKEKKLKNTRTKSSSKSNFWLIMICPYLQGKSLNEEIDIAIEYMKWKTLPTCSHCHDIARFFLCTHKTISALKW